MTLLIFMYTVVSLKFVYYIGLSIYLYVFILQRKVVRRWGEKKQKIGICGDIRRTLRILISWGAIVVRASSGGTESELKNQTDKSAAEVSPPTFRTSDLILAKQTDEFTGNWGWNMAWLGDTHTDQGKNGHRWWTGAPEGSHLPPHPTYIANLPSLSTNNKLMREQLVKGMRPE